MDINLKEIAIEIRKIIENRQKEIDLTFVEEDHIYYMRDLNGTIRTDFPSVSKLFKKFYKPFDGHTKSLEMVKGDVVAQKKLLQEWADAGTLATNMGSRVHYMLESELVRQYGSFKEVRRPIFECDEPQIIKGDAMISAGKDYLDLMHERGAVLLDTEMVLGDNFLKYTGQPDKFWLMMNKEKTDFGVVTTDWKTNQPKKFVRQWYTDKMYWPFEKYDNTDLSHYYLQLPLYCRLLSEMLKGSKYESINILGCVVVLLKENGTYEEFRVPKDVITKVYNLDLDNYIKL